jgi:hypothetical protein
MISMQLVLTSTKATETHMTVVSSALKTSVRAGKAIFVMLASMVAMKVPMATLSKMFHLFVSSLKGDFPLEVGSLGHSTVNTTLYLY